MANTLKSQAGWKVVAFAAVAVTSIGLGTPDAAADAPQSCEDYVTLTGLDGATYYAVADLDVGTWGVTTHYLFGEGGAWQETNGTPGLQCQLWPEDTGRDTKLAGSATFVPVWCPSVPYIPEFWLNGVLDAACYAVFGG